MNDYSLIIHVFYYAELSVKGRKHFNGIVCISLTFSKPISAGELVNNTLIVFRKRREGKGVLHFTFMHHTIEAVMKHQLLVHFKK